jgi:deoxyribonuclease-4
MSPAPAPAPTPPPRPRPRLPGGRRAGPHLPIHMGLLHAAERAAEIQAWSIQIFTDNPTAWHRRASPPAEVPAFRRRLAELDVAPLAIHAAYLVNLAGPDPILFGKSVEVLRHELRHAPEYGARFVNVHAGSHRGSGREAGVERLVEGLSRAIGDLPAGPDDPFLVVENSSGGGDAIGVTIEDLAAVLDKAGRRGVDGRLRFCLDTAHLWGAGYDISTPAAIDRLVAEFDSRVGLERLAMIHLNDTLSGLGSRHDRHIHLGEGQIGPAALTRLLRHPALAGVAFYLETPRMEHGYDAVNMARVYDLAAGRPLTPGPEPAAIEGSGPSGRSGTAEGPGAAEHSTGAAEGSGAAEHSTGAGR